MNDHTHRPSNDPEAFSPAGLYIHVPFCRAKCAYCDFYSVTHLNRIDDFIQALLRELNRFEQTIPLADSIYFGGGTPSVLTPGQVEAVLEALVDRFPIADDTEVTLEVNPGTVGRADLTAFRRAGVNRLNIGMQAINDARLTFLGRIHTARQGMATFEWARTAGFDNLGLDLIYGTPGHTVRRWVAEMEAVVRMAPDHLSCYSLTLEPGTPMARQVRDGYVRLPDEQTVGDLFDATADFLEGNGYRWYEVSNFARNAADIPDRRSRHNRKYWRLAPYLGFGPAAHSFLNGVRWWNHRSLDDYLANLTAGTSPVASRETLNQDQQIIEFVYLGLRQTDGIDTAAFGARFGISFSRYFRSQMESLMEEGLLAASADRILVTRRGMRFLESVVSRLLV